jgi:F-type H+-transporting ATPase subunit a
LKNPRTIAVVIGALVLLGVGFLFFRSPKPIIEIKGEKLTDLGFFPLLNTYLTSVIVVIVLIALAWYALRRLNMIPSGMQNAVEAVADALYTICINTAGEKHGRRFFPVVATIFVYIWIANWMALLPGFISIGGVEAVDGHHFHHEGAVFEKTAGISFIRPNETELEFHEEEAPSWEAYEELGAEIDELEAAGAPAAEVEELEHQREEALEHAREEAILEALHEEHLVPEEITNFEEAQQHLEDGGKTVGILIPYLRSMNTDINSPLSIAIIAMIFIEFWGIMALGVFKYGSKFFNFSSPINFIVGLLEFVAEIARVISFTFRLFGNMLAGEILLLVMTFLVPFLIAIPFYGLEVFVGLIQAFVFAMLTLVFGTLAVSSHEGHDEPGGHEDPDRPLEGPVPVMHA